jgi:hypothetical protein
VSNRIKLAGLFVVSALVLSLIAVLPTGAASGTIAYQGGVTNAGVTWYSLATDNTYGGTDDFNLVTVVVTDGDENSATALPNSFDVVVDDEWTFNSDDNFTAHKTPLRVPLIGLRALQDGAYFGVASQAPGGSIVTSQDIKAGDILTNREEMVLDGNGTASHTTTGGVAATTVVLRSGTDDDTSAAGIQFPSAFTGTPGATSLKITFDEVTEGATTVTTAPQLQVTGRLVNSLLQDINVAGTVEATPADDLVVYAPGNIADDATVVIDTANHVAGLATTALGKMFTTEAVDTAATTNPGGTDVGHLWKSVTGMKIKYTATGAQGFTIKVQETYTAAAQYQYDTNDTLASKVTIDTSSGGGLTNISLAEVAIDANGTVLRDAAGTLTASPDSGVFAADVVLTGSVADHGKTGTAIFTSLSLAGIHDSGADAAALADADGNFATKGVRVGDIVKNTTDGSQGVITAVTDAAVTATLAGGTDNNWDVSDAVTFEGARVRVFVNNGAEISAVYADASPVASVTASARADLAAPVLVVSSPSAAFINTDAPKLEGTLEDAAVFGTASAGITAANISLVIEKPDNTVVNETANIVGPTLVELNDQKWAFLRQFSSGQVVGQWEWWVPVMDKVGNVASFAAGGPAGAGNPAAVTTKPAVPLSYTIDTAAPVIVAAEVQTGGAVHATTNDWSANTTATTIISIGIDNGGGAFTPSVASIDATTVDINDFSIALDAGGTAAVSSITVADDVNGNAGEVIVLTLSQALATNETPAISPSSTFAVNDTAGNAIAIFTAINAVDDLSPTVTVTCGGAACVSQVAQATMTVSISSSEDAGLPTVVARYLEIAGDDSIQKSADNGFNADIALTSKVASVTNSTWTLDVGIADIGNGGKGKVSLEVSVTDSASNVGTAGIADPDANSDGVFDAGAVTFEFDNLLNNGDATVANIFSLRPTISGQTTQTDSLAPFVVATFVKEGLDVTSEADDGSLDTHDNINVATAKLVHPLATGQTTATETDVVGNIARQKGVNNSYVLATAGLGLIKGAYTLKLTVTDDAGNTTNAAYDATSDTTKAVTKSFDFAFTIVEKPQWKLTLVPGMNLISVPGVSTQTDVNVVFADATIDMVSTYDPFSIGSAFKSAVRNPATGLLEGSLSAIDASNAYFVSTTSFVEIALDVATPGFDATPPSVRLLKGWNLVPVIDVGVGAADTGVAASTYFAGLGTAFTSSLTWNTTGNAWVKIQTADDAGDAVNSLDSENDGVDDEVQVGHGYWVYTTADGTIVP